MILIRRDRLVLSELTISKGISHSKIMQSVIIRKKNVENVSRLFLLHFRENRHIHSVTRIGRSDSELESWERKGRNIRTCALLRILRKRSAQRCSGCICTKWQNAVLVGQSLLPTSCLSERTILQ